MQTSIEIPNEGDAKCSEVALQYGSAGLGSQKLCAEVAANPSDKRNTGWSNPGVLLLAASQRNKANPPERHRSGHRGREEETNHFHLPSKNRPKTERGCFRTLAETGNVARPARAMIGFLNSFDWNCESDEKLLDGDIEKKVRNIVKWSAAPNGLMSGEFSTHSLRSGGATAMYVRGISVEHIQRFGRWASDTDRRYLYRDNQVFRFLGRSMVMATGLLDQLQMTQPAQKAVSLDVMEASDQDDDDQFRAGGKFNETPLGDKQENHD